MTALPLIQNHGTQRHHNRYPVRKASVNIETIRYYQRRGLLQEPPKPVGRLAVSAGLDPTDSLSNARSDWALAWKKSLI